MGMGKYILISGGAILFIVLIGMVWFFGTYNSLVATDQDVNAA